MDGEPTTRDTSASIVPSTVSASDLLSQAPTHHARAAAWPSNFNDGEPSDAQQNGPSGKSSPLDGLRLPAEGQYNNINNDSDGQYNPKNAGFIWF